MKRFLILLLLMTTPVFCFAARSAKNSPVIVSDVLQANGIRHIVVTPSKDVCSTSIDIELKGDIIQSVVYTRGCDGNAKGLGALLKDMKIDEAIKRLEGIPCGSKSTSCPDQLAKALKLIKKHKPTSK